MPSPSAAKENIAVIGAGAAGLGAAWLLSRGNYAVTLYDAASHAGGHAHTVDLPLPHDQSDVTIPVDLGFIVYNTRTYPDLVSLFEFLQLEEDNSSMSFAASVEQPDGTFFEWGSDSLATLFADRSSLYRTSMYTMLYDMRRFNNAVHDFVQRAAAESHFSRRGITLGEFLDAEGYSTAFIRYYLIPMVSSVWSASFNSALSFPAISLFTFFVNHGLAQVFARPQWRTPSHRSRDYVTKMLSDIQKNDGVISLENPVEKVERLEESVTVYSAKEQPKRFHQVVFATHAPVTLQLLGEYATEDEMRVLGTFQYASNAAYVHNDSRFMPTNKATWGAWNFISRRSHDGEAIESQRQTSDDSPVCVSYWLNKLQNYHKYPHPVPDLFLTLNPVTPIDPDKRLAEVSFDHPQFTKEAAEAQPVLQSLLQGKNRSWFCGSYARYGFHEDAMMTGLDVAERLSGQAILRPWRAKHALAINNNYSIYQLPFSPPRTTVFFFLTALLVLNAVMHRLQQGLGKIAARMADTDPVIVISTGDGRLHKFGPRKLRARSRSMLSISRDSEALASVPVEAAPVRARITVRNPRVLVRIAESLRQGYELAPTAAAAFAASEVDCPSPEDLIIALRALFVADGLDVDPSTTRKGRAKFAESLLSTLLGGFEKIGSLPTYTRLPELTTCLFNVVYPSWWLQSDSTNGERNECNESSSSRSGLGAVFSINRDVRRTLELLGDLSERTVLMLQNSDESRATIVVKTAERMAFVHRKAELLFVQDQVDVVLLSDFLDQSKSDLRSSGFADSDERLYDMILSPALLNGYTNIGFNSIQEALNFLRELASTTAYVELGMVSYGTRRLKQASGLVHGSDSLFAGDDGFKIWKVSEVITVTEQRGFELQDMCFMDHEEAATDVLDAIQRMYDTLATEKLDQMETRTVLAQMCLWEAALSVKYIRRTALSLTLA